ncbi:MAG: non-ribosomal peptide synthetase module, partial [Vallitaleaceae bacterium]|nr:non-ribosomal peptide synthetase module [Vallitaleaceae bacterium]
YMDQEVRGLMSEFAQETDTVILSAGEYLYLVPLTVHSDFHISNQEIKDVYLPSRSTNMDIYLLYVAGIVLIGEFYDSYQTHRITRDFLSIDEWMSRLDERMEALKSMDEKALEILEQEYEYNWLGIIKQWDSIDIIKEGVSKQSARTNSRKSFMNIAAEFMKKEGLVEEIGLEELCLTEKAKVIVQKFFMDVEFNRGILEVLYQMSNYEEYKKKGEKNADHIED